MRAFSHASRQVLHCWISCVLNDLHFFIMLQDTYLIRHIVSMESPMKGIIISSITSSGIIFFDSYPILIDVSSMN